MVSRGVEDEIGSFLARWSRRKAAARRGRPEPEPQDEPKREVGGQGAAEPSFERAAPASERLKERTTPAPNEPAFDIASLPDPDTLDASSDFSQFMRPGVPLDLQRRALRRLWRINPIISTPSEIDDYYIVNDFSDASTVVADLKTLYRVGRGMIAALEEEREGTGEEGADAAVGADAEPTERSAGTPPIAQERSQEAVQAEGSLETDRDLLSRA